MIDSSPIGPSDSEVTEIQPSETVQTATIPKRRGRPSRKETAALKQEVIKYARAEPLASQREIAAAVGVNRATVAGVLAKYHINKEELDSYKENQADIMVGLQHRIAKSITDEDIKKAGLQSRLTAFGIIFDKFRIQTGQSTANIASWVNVVTQAHAVKAVE